MKVEGTQEEMEQLYRLTLGLSQDRLYPNDVAIQGFEFRRSAANPFVYLGELKLQEFRRTQSSAAESSVQEACTCFGTVSRSCLQHGSQP